MPRRMTIGGNKQHFAVAKDIMFSVDELIVERVVKVNSTWAVAHHATRATCSLHLRFLHQDRGMGEKLIATTVIKVQMRIDHIGNIVRLQTALGELTDDVISHLGANANPSGAFFSQPADGIGDGLAVHARVKEQAPLRVHDQITRHRHRTWGTRGMIGQEIATIQSCLPTTQFKKINLYYPQ